MNIIITLIWSCTWRGYQSYQQYKEFESNWPAQSTSRHLEAESTLWHSRWLVDKFLQGHCGLAMCLPIGLRVSQFSFSKIKPTHQTDPTTDQSIFCYTQWKILSRFSIMTSLKYQPVWFDYQQCHCNPHFCDSHLMKEHPANITPHCRLPL